MGRIIPLFGALIALWAPALAAAPDTKPLPAETIMTAAKRQAQREHKPIFLMFDASW